MSSSLGQSASVWMNVGMPNTAPLREDATTDVCVVGAGIAGLSTAYHLAREGRHVLVVDDRAIGSGETSRTTAHLSHVLDDRIFALARLHGNEAARLAVESHMAAITRIEQVIKLEGIHCQFERLDGYLFEGATGDALLLDCEYDAAREAGLVDTEWATQAPLSSFDTGRCLRFPNQAAFHPLKYLVALADRVVALGGRIHTGTRVTEMAEGGPPMQLITKDGPRIRANAVVVATNAPAIGSFHLAGKQVAMRSYALSATIPAGSVTRALYWDTLDPYHYVRVATNQQGHDDYLIVGGEDHRTGQEENPTARFHQLEEWTRARFPMVTSIDHRWSGQVLEPVDGLAFIGRSGEHHDVYCVSGDSGQGMTHGTIAGILLTDLLQGRKNPWEALYAPTRDVKGASGTLLREAANRMAQFKDLLTPGDVDSEADIAPGTGAILRRGLDKIAAYRDPGGTLHECDATCTHRGCVVQWNAVEHTWDCPCHGSRFNPVGRVINGPAIDDLPVLASPRHSTRAT